MAVRKKRARKKNVGSARPAARQATTPSGVGDDEASALVRSLQEQGVTRAKIGGFDVDGVLRGKYVSLDKLRSALRTGFGFCDVIFGWDVADALYDNAKVTGWHTGYPDAHAVLDPSTLRVVPWEPGVAAMLCDFRDASGGPHPACPRSLLSRVLSRAEDMGFTAKVGIEYEFFFFRETRESLYAKHFHDLQPLEPGMFGYSWVRSGQESALMRSIMEELLAFDIELEGLHTETGPGVYEAAIRYDDALRAADKAALFKAALKQIAHRHGLVVTFMAKWNASLPGCSGHIHQSLWHKGKNAFLDARGGMSRVMKSYIGGQLHLMRELTACYSPTVNSYKRYVPGLWAPLVASWGVENRTCAVRVIGKGTPALRVEYRQTAADINPYVAMAASLGAGLWGIENGIPLPAETRGDPGSEGPGRLPTNLRAATELLLASKPARDVLGEAFVDHYARTRLWEARAYETAVTDWELARYFEVI